MERIAYFSNITITALHQLSASDGSAELPCFNSYLSGIDDENVTASLQGSKLLLTFKDCTRRYTDYDFPSYGFDVLNGLVTIEFSELAKEGQYLTFNADIDINLVEEWRKGKNGQVLTASAKLIQTISDAHETLLQITVKEGSTIEIPVDQVDESGGTVVINQATLEKRLNYKTGQYSVDINVERADGIVVSTPVAVSGFRNTVFTSGYFQAEQDTVNVFKSSRNDGSLYINGIHYQEVYFWNSLMNFLRQTTHGPASIRFPNRKNSIEHYSFNGPNLPDNHDELLIYAAPSELVEVLQAEAPYFASVRYALMPEFDESELLSAEFLLSTWDYQNVVEGIDFEVEIDGPWITVHLYEPLPTEGTYIFDFLPTTEEIPDYFGLYLTNKMLTGEE